MLLHLHINRKSPDSDKTTNDMLFNRGPTAEKEKTPSYSWRTAKVPQVWTEAIVVPVHKKGIDKTKADSYLFV